MKKNLSYINGLFKLNKQSFSAKTFKANDLIFEENKDLFIKPDYSQPLQFGKFHSDYMLEIDHDVKTGWEKPRISKFKNFSIDPRNQSLHYAMQLFEGMKAYRNKDGKLYLFRPELNMQRLRSSAKRIGFPDFDGEEFIKLISELVKIEKLWIKDEPGYSLYLRPTFISMTDILGVLPPSKTKLFCICSPVGPYFGTKPVMNSIKVMCNDNSYVRAFQGGFGQFKLGANYGPTIELYQKATSAGYNHILWLIDDHITEVGVMNVFIHIKNKKGESELITAPLDGTILPGVTRQSILDYCKDEKINAVERKIEMSEFLDLHKNGNVIEVFGCGTATLITPISVINYKGKDYSIDYKGNAGGPLSEKFYKVFSDIQNGFIKHRFQREII